MTDSRQLFEVDTLHDAIAATVQQIGGWKRVAAALRPEWTIDRADRWLRDCCNPDRDHELKPEQLAMIRRMARDAGVHTLIEYEMGAAGYEVPKPVHVESEQVQLQREMLAAMERFEASSARLERLMQLNGGKAKLRGVANE